MDIVTQGLAGAVLAQSANRQAPARVVLAVGAFAGMLADADVLIGSADDPLLTLDFHRHFTHSLIFVPIGALIATLIAWPIARRHLSPGALYGFALLGYLPSGLLDACTSFGTHLLWPFSDARTAWNLIAVVDPIFSLVLIGGVVLSLRRATHWPARFALVLALAYLGAGGVQQARARAMVLDLVASRGHVPVRLEVKPTIGNLVLWRTIYEEENKFHVDAVRAGFGRGRRLYAGESVERLSPGFVARFAPGSRMRGDIERFERFADGFVAVHPTLPDIVGDMRYALLPTSAVPLWGIEVDPTALDSHAAFRTFRQTTTEQRRQFVTMLRGLPTTH